jgi:hypothetical protein
MKPLALAIKQELRPDDWIVGYRMSVVSSLIYYTDHHVDWVDDPGTLQRMVCAPGRVFLVIARPDHESLDGQLPGGLRRFADRGGTDVLLKPVSVRCAAVH